MARPFKSESYWYGSAAGLMVRSDYSLSQALEELKIELSMDDLRYVERSAAFRRALWTERFKFYKEICGNPDRDKISTIGQLTVLAQNLQEKGSWDKAGEILLKVAKLEGWVGVEGQVNLVGGLSEKDWKEIERRLKAESEARLTAVSSPVPTVAVH